MNTLLIIDGNALVHRAYHALPEFKTKDGIYTNALYGFASILRKVVADYKPTYLLVCFDAPGKTFRDEMFKDYRSHRPKSDKELISQFPLIKGFLEASSISFIEKKGIEADDLIAIYAKRAKNKKIKTLILTGDKDIFQLIDKTTFILTPQIGYAKGRLYDTKQVLKQFGVPPKHITDFKALAGDPSDNYRGVAGIGPKTASALIQEYGSVEEIYKKIDKIENKTIREKLKKDKKNALLSKKLAVLVTDRKVSVKLADTKFEGYNEKLKDFFEKYEFKTLSRRFFAEVKNNKKAVKKQGKNQPGLF